jgi:hypothetical protein
MYTTVTESRSQSTGAGYALMALLRNEPDSLDALVAATADTLGIDAAFVEKDFWVIEVLRAATGEVTVLAKDGQRYPVQTIFKGGTSLSRAYGLIERFSEDVDLLVAFPDAELSIGARNKALKAIRDAVAAHLGTEFTAVASTTGVKRNVRRGAVVCRRAASVPAGTWRCGQQRCGDQRLGAGCRRLADTCRHGPRRTVAVGNRPHSQHGPVISRPGRAVSRCCEPAREIEAGINGAPRRVSSSQPPPPPAEAPDNATIHCDNGTSRREDHRRYEAPGPRMAGGSHGTTLRLGGTPDLRTSA